MTDYGWLLIYLYLPHQLIPEEKDLDFDEFYRLFAMAQIARELRIEDIEVGTNKGYVAAHKGDG